MSLRVPGHGLPLDQPGPSPGDLFLVIRTADDPRFERIGRDLYHVETIDVVDAVSAPPSKCRRWTDRRPSTYRPARSRTLCCVCAGKACQASAADSRGNLFIRLRVHVPERLSEQQRKLFEKLRSRK